MNKRLLIFCGVLFLVISAQCKISAFDWCYVSDLLPGNTQNFTSWLKSDPLMATNEFIVDNTTNISFLLGALDQKSQKPYTWNKLIKISAFAYLAELSRGLHFACYGNDDLNRAVVGPNAVLKVAISYALGRLTVLTWKKSSQLLSKITDKIWKKVNQNRVK